LTDKRILAYDFECFRYNFLVVIIDYETREKTVIKDDPIALQRFYDEHSSDIWVGYNSRGYDQYILKGILLGYDPYYITQEIIINDKKGNQIVKQADEIQLYNYDVSTGFHSLKQLEGFMGSTIKESDVPFDIDRKLTQEEIDQVEFYCTHDVTETIKVFENRRADFDSQLLVIEMFNLPFSMFNKTKAQLAATVLGAKRGRDRYDDFEIEIPDTLRVGSRYHYIVEWYQDPANRDYNKSLVTDVAGIPHVFAWGGVHGAIPNFSAEGIILQADVASLYPSLMIEYGYQSRNIRDKNIYREIRDKRLALKAVKDPMEAPLKIVINATYGAMKDKHNPLYDPLQANNVCIAGQLLLLDLIEKVEPYCKLIQLTQWLN
jgi:hypothetical protein